MEHVEAALAELGEQDHEPGMKLSRRPQAGRLREPLTQSEIRVLRYLPTNLSQPEIAEELALSVNTIQHAYPPLQRSAEFPIVNPMVQYPTTVDRAFAALADPTRRAVLERLGSGSATISELAEPFGMSLTGMKKHIRLLEEAQLVTTEKVGRVRRCMLAPYAFEGISTWLQLLDRFAQVVERTKGDR
jgi:DNA-binding transcriptional ArsR family regulator